MKALLIDDEKKNRDSLGKLLKEYCGEVEVIGEASSVEEALAKVKQLKPDLVFLDVEMPNGTGFDFLRQVGEITFRIIFVTAHSHYAIKAIRFAAVDYLLKPVDTDDLVKAVQRASETSVKVASVQYESLMQSVSSARSAKLAIPVKDGFAFLEPEEIIRLQADGTYTHIFTQGQKFTGTKNIKEYEELLAEYNFFRSHNSHLINLKHVKRFSRLDGYFVYMSDDSVAEISRRKKEEFIGMMSKV